MSSPLIIALDLNNKEALKLAKKLDSKDCNLKVGSQLFTSGGPEIVLKLKDLGFNIFLDLKFHDIPNTVNQAVRSCLDLGIWMLNVHASGGAEMLRASTLPLKDKKQKPILIGVSVLTSLDEASLKEVGIKKNLKNQVISLSKLCQKNGLDGVVCSAKEIKPLRRELGNEFILVTPGIRKNQSADDQKRFATPVTAIESGADYIVLGREVIFSKDPSLEIKEILEDISKIN